MAKKPWKEHLEEIQSALASLRSATNLTPAKIQKQWLKICNAASLIPKNIRRRYTAIPWDKIIRLKKASDPAALIKELHADLQNFEQNFSAFYSEVNTTAHPWKICPPGEVYIHKTTVSEHTRGRRLIREHLRSDHCRNIGNYELHNVLTPQEVHDISEMFFGNILGPPSKDDFKYFDKGNQYDHLIRGWTQYWNDIFKPAEPLDPNLVKALIASESSFNPNINTNGKAKGLMQLMPLTIKSLNGYRAELKDHLFEVETKDIFDPNVNIAAGIRWLFNKRATASRRLKRDASWIETVEEFKGILIKRLRNEPFDPNVYSVFSNYYKKLKEQK